MKKTAMLRVNGEPALPENSVSIHPNDGFDLGLVVLNNSVYLQHVDNIKEIHSTDNKKSEGTLILKNECPMGTIELNRKDWEQNRCPKCVQLVYKEPVLYLIHINSDSQ